MLTDLHVKNLALMKDVEISFGDSLNILSGETGAGKSMLLKALLLCFGGKASKEDIRYGEEEADIELVLKIQSEKEREVLKNLGIVPEDSLVILQRIIREDRSLCKVNGEIVLQSVLRTIAETFMELSAQKEHADFLKEENQIMILDSYMQGEADTEKNEYTKCYERFKEKNRLLKDIERPREERERELDLLEFQMSEFAELDLQKGDLDRIKTDYQKLLTFSQQRKIYGEAEKILQEQILAGIGNLTEVFSGLPDEKIKKVREELLKNEAGIFSDFLRDLQKEQASLSEWDDEKAEKLEKKSELIAKLKRRYGDTEEKLLEAYENCRNEYRACKEGLEREEEIKAEMELLKQELVSKAAALHERRVLFGQIFAKDMEDGLRSLNFLKVSFEVRVEKTGRYGKNGNDEVTFYISVNPGEPLKPLAKVSSGGELSRIMLCIREKMAKKLPGIRKTLILDEIDEGMSGETAKTVAVKMREISKNHQMIVISHLPQVIAAAKTHFEIEKKSDGNQTITTVRRLSEKDSIENLAKILSDGTVTQTALENAIELKNKIGSDKERL